MLQLFSRKHSQKDKESALLPKLEQLQDLRAKVNLANMSKYQSGHLSQSPEYSVNITDNEASIIRTLSEKDGRIFREYLTVSQYMSFICELELTGLPADHMLQTVSWETRINNLDRKEKKILGTFLATISNTESHDVKKAIFESDSEELLSLSDQPQQRASCILQ